MNGTKWALLALIAFGLLVFGYKAHIDQQTAPVELSRAPIAVAAVRGSSQGMADVMPTASNSFVDYTKGLQDDVSIARRNVKKYEGSARTESKAVGEGDSAQ